MKRVNLMLIEHLREKELSVQELRAILEVLDLGYEETAKVCFEYLMPGALPHG